MSLPSLRPSRVIIDKLKPEVDGGRFGARRYIDEEVEIVATLLLDGHDHVKGRLLYKHESEKSFKRVPFVTSPEDIGNDRWRARFSPQKLGRYILSAEAAIDRFDTWRSDVLKKLEAGQKISVDLLSGVELLERILSLSSESDKKTLSAVVVQLKKWSQDAKGLEYSDLKTLLYEKKLEQISADFYDDPSMVQYREIPLQIEPKIARFSSWYEFFPRSRVDGKLTHGDFKISTERLDYVKDLGFNVVYLPPIHPIGRAFRKGKNNSLEPAKDDVGSPWAIGGEAGGHKDILPELGTLQDFKKFLKTAESLELNVALDIAFQCSPDHPYVKEHPEWFKKRPDGTIQYAENPPKKYQDIYPFDFESEDWQGLWTELKSVVQYWVDQGVKVFRVDNPHTKPFAFWEWLIQDIKKKHPEVVFLAEAFTRPQVMGYLAKAGFSQSYTYFTWRNTKWELTQYLTELTKTELVDYFGPNFWPNTPDILPFDLQKPSRNMFILRVGLAATLSSNYGIYGPAYELMEHKRFKEGGEEYLDSEKYELKSWNLEQKDSLAPTIKQFNEIRNLHPAFQQNRNIEFHLIPNESILAFSKSFNGEHYLVIANLTPDQVQSGQVELPLKEWQIGPTDPIHLEDLLTGQKLTWMGWRNYVELRPEALPLRIFKIRGPK